MKRNKITVIALFLLFIQAHALIEQLFNDGDFNLIFSKFPIQLEASDNNIFQIKVQNQFGGNDTCPNPSEVFGATCGRHAFKNSILGLLALNAYQNKNRFIFNRFSSGLINLTKDSQCLFKEINLKVDQFRKETEEFYKAAGEEIPEHEATLSPEEVEFVLNHVTEITKKCKLPTLQPQQFAFIYFPPEGIKNFLKGQYGKQLIEALNRISNNADYTQAILILIGGHWINVIVKKDQGNLKFLIFDSANNANRLNDDNVKELVNLVVNTKTILEDIANEEAQIKEMEEKLRKYLDLKDDIYDQPDLKQIVDELIKIANQNLANNIKQKANLLLGKIYFYGGNGIQKNLKEAEKYLVIAHNLAAGIAEKNVIQNLLDGINKKQEEQEQKEQRKSKEETEKKIKEKEEAEQQQIRQFKNTLDTLTKQANVLQQFRIAQANKNTRRANQLKPQVQKIRQALAKTKFNIKNNQGQTPIMLNPRIAFAVAQIGKPRAKNIVNAKDNNGKRVIQYLIQSKQNDNVNIYRILKNSGVQVTPNDIKVIINKLKNKPRVRNQIVNLLEKK